MRGKYKRVAGWKAKDCGFVAANVNERGGEIDLIMREGRTTVFVEVRYRRSALYGGAAASVTRSSNNTNYYRLPACGSRVIMGVLILWIAGSMW